MYGKPYERPYAADEHLCAHFGQACEVGGRQERRVLGV